MGPPLATVLYLILALLTYVLSITVCLTGKEVGCPTVEGAEGNSIFALWYPTVLGSTGEGLTTCTELLVGVLMSQGQGVVNWVASLTIQMPSSSWYGLPTVAFE